MTLNIIENRKIWYAFSSILLIASIVFVATLGLNFGIDFTGGSLSEIRFDQAVATADLRSALEEAGYKGISIQATDESAFIIRTESLGEEEHQHLLLVLNTLASNEELRFDSIGPVIGNELRRTALIGLVVTLFLIGLYVAWAFRLVSQPVESWKYGVLTIVAAFHDAIITVGAFSLLGFFFNWEVGTAFVAALLTILGYSINDTVIIFDRTRENLLRKTGDTFPQTVEHSIHQTLTRSLSTSLTTLLALLAVFFFGGDSTQPFAMALIIGIGVGTYSSIFLASPLLVTWNQYKSR